MSTIYSTNPEVGGATRLGTVNSLQSILTQNSLPAAEVREVIQKEVEARRGALRDLYHEIAHLHSVHNLVVPLNSLPPELLTIIFSYVETSSARNDDLISLTHVCKHWREVALQTPILWTRIVQNHPDGVKAFLERSKTLPLRITFTTSHLPLLAVPRLISPELRRVVTLNVLITSNVPVDVITRRLLRVVAPQLEELTVGRIMAPPGRARDPEPDFVVSPGEFEGVPALRSLILRGVPLPYLPKGPTMLTNIYLGAMLPTLGILLDLLERSPLLERLSIHGLFNEELDMDPRKIALPHLKVLEIRTFPPQAIPIILSNLVLPKQTDIYLNASLDLGEDFLEIIPAYGSGEALSFDCLKGLKRLELGWGHCGLSLQAFRGVDDFHSPALQVKAGYADPPPDQRFFWDWPMDPSQIEMLVLSAEFTVHHPFGDWCILVPQWMNMLGALPALKALRVMSVNHGTFYNLVRALGADEPQPLCAGLETLELFDVVWPPTEAARQQYREMLKVMVMKRSPQAGGNLKRLELFNSGSTVWWESMAPEIRGAGVVIDGLDE